MNIASRVLVVVLLLGLVAAPAFAKKDKKASDAPGTFELQSELIARDPDVAEALAAAKGSPSDATTWNRLGQVLAGKGDNKDAVAAFERALGIEPESNVYVSNKGAALMKMGDTKAALSLFQKALEIEPFDAIAYYNLGVAYNKLGKYDDSLEAFKAAFLINPDLQDPQKNAAVVNNEHIMAIGLEVYLETAGATPAVYQDEPEGD